MSRREVAAGIVILVLVAALCATLIADIRRPRPGLFEVPGLAAAAPMEPESPFAPPPLELEGWSGPAGTRTYDRETVYRKIDGRADLFLKAGFQMLTFARYTASGDPSISLQLYLYDMGSPGGARSVYQAEKPPAGEPLRLGAAGYRSGPAVFFIQGPAYVSVLGSDPAAAQISLHLARRIASLLDPARAQEPPP